MCYNPRAARVCGSPRMAKDTQINVRFPAEIDRRLTETAIQLGVSKSALVRRVTEMFVDEVTAAGVVRLNPMWIRDLTGADGRSPWGRPKKFSGEDSSAKVAEESAEYRTKKQP